MQISPDKATEVKEDKAQELQRAFNLFNQVSVELTQAYEGLQARVESLTQELAVANGELLRQYQEKEALSERLSLLLNALPAGVVVLDNADCVSEVNPAAGGMLGEITLGMSWPTISQTSLMATEAPDEWTLGENHENRERRVSIVESALDSAGGRILLIHDMTAAHNLKNDLERNKRLAAMGEMAASLAHQLRTPLATALLYSANLAQANLADTARIRFAEKTSTQLQRLERLIQDVLLFARGESIGRELISVKLMLSETVQTMAPLCKSKGITFSSSLDVGESIMTGSRKALSGALLNLLENALQACERKSEGAGEISLTAKICGKSVEIKVDDNGEGMSPEIQSRIFEPFFTTRGQGTGLGLAIVLGVLRAHGGQIDAESQLGRGTSFCVSLPIGSTQHE